MPPRGTPEEQKQIIEDLLTKGVKGIAISPNAAVNQAPFLNKVAEQVPLITQDSDLPPGSKRLCYIGTNNFEAGKAAGELVKQAIPDGGQVMIYVGKLDVQNAVERRNGVIAALAGVADLAAAAKLMEQPYPLTFGRYTVLGTMTDDAKQEQCKVNVEDTLVKYPEIKCLVGLWAYNPPAMLTAVKAAQKEGKVALVGFDENEETLQGIKDGYIHSTVVQQPFEFGYHAIKILAHLARGDRAVLPPDGILYIPHQIIKRDNVEEFHAQLKKLKGT
jgi:ribose transport system substrate-binding protein